MALDDWLKHVVKFVCMCFCTHTYIIHYVHTYVLTGIGGNELADKLAKEAAGDDSELKIV